jgi:zinc transport system substrate-binding protein
MKRIIMLLLFVLLVTAIPGCKKQEESKTGLTCAVSIFPLYDMARNIAGDRAAVIYVIPAGSDPHTYEPLPSIAEKLQDTGLFIGVTKEFDGWIERYLPDAAVRKYLMPLPGNHGDGKNEPNPHVWLSVKRAKIIAGKMARYLSDADGDKSNEASYKKNLDIYIEKLDRLDASIALMFKNKKNKSFIQWHDAWNYFASDYGLSVVATVQQEGSDKSSVRSIKNIIDTARREKATAVVTSLNAEVKGAQILAREIGGTVVRLDSIGNPDSKERSDYLKMMHFDASRLAGALR